MPLTPALLRAASGLGAMGGGSVAVVALLGVMNRAPEAPPASAEGPSTRFELATPPPPPPPRPEPAPRRPPTRRPARNTAPAAPRVGAAVGSMSLGLGPAAWSGGEAQDRSLLGDTRDVAMTEDTVDRAPVPVERAPPQLPARLRNKGITGSVLLRLLVDEEGRVAEVHVQEAEPPDTFEEAALEAARRWRFQPGLHRGAPVRVWLEAPIEFRY